MMFSYDGKDKSGNEIWKRRNYDCFDEVLLINSSQPQLFTVDSNNYLIPTIMTQEVYDFAMQVQRGEVNGNSGV